MNNKNRENPDLERDLRTDKRKVGDKGEDLAVEFLMKQGYAIKDRNYLRKYGELDIVAVKGDIWHFIEVKTVSYETNRSVIHETVNGYRPEDNLHPWKLQRLSRVIQAYMIDKRLYENEWQFDVITVKIKSEAGEAELEFLENIIL